MVVSFGIIIFIPAIIMAIRELDFKVRDLQKRIDYLQQQLDSNEETIRSITKNDNKQVSSIESLKQEIINSIGGGK
jgi:predicted  nucleic acid-binding Zn-ribbon protein